MRPVVFLLALASLLVCTSLAAAGEPPVPIEGKLVMGVATAPDMSPEFQYFTWLITGTSDSITPMAAPYEAEMSPAGDKLLGSHLCICNLDGSGGHSLSEVAGLTGTNCWGRWSPDGSMIVFQHAEPGPLQLNCEAGWQVWVMDADGTGAQPVVSTGVGWPPLSVWSPDGYRILLWHAELDSAAMIDADGTELEPVPVAGEWSPDGSLEWSPDGSLVAYGACLCDPAANGFWRLLVVETPEGGIPLVLAEQFVSHDKIAQNLALWPPPYTPLPFDFAADARWHVGPTLPRWSPKGDRVAFVAALPFDAELLPYKLQKELWVCEVSTGDLTRLTTDVLDERHLSWSGANSLPEDPEVTVFNTTVTFSGVTEEGLTTIIRDDDPPELPGGYQFCGEYYNISTAAGYTGPITICMTYEEEDVPGGNEEALCLLHYNETTEEYDDITTFKDTGENKVCGEVDSLSVFGLAVAPPVFGGFRPPINPDGTSVWRAGRTVPVKFALSDLQGNPITRARCHLTYLPWEGESVGPVSEVEEASSADADGVFRYDTEENQYIYNLSTKGLEPNAYLLVVTAEGWPEFQATVKIGLR